MRTSSSVHNDSEYIYTLEKGENCLLYHVKNNLSKDQFFIRIYEIPNFTRNGESPVCKRF